MKKAYLYPISLYLDKTIPNPYLSNFMDGLDGAYDFLNRDHPSNKGILDLAKYIRKIDTIFLNWIEDLPDKRGGFIQSFFFVAMVFVLKMRRIKIIWVMHNKKSHYDSNTFLKGFLFRFVLKKSDLIITHSKEGLHYLDEYKVKNKEKGIYFPHPLFQNTLQMNLNPSIDILIWGSIIPYKGIDRFLDFLHSNRLEGKYKIVIAGKVKPPEYEKTIKRYCNESILLDNRYVPEKNVLEYMADSKSVLFTYIGNSVLSSGALMDSLSYGLNVLAPNVGAFKDAKEEGLIETYNSFKELTDSLDVFLNPVESKKERIEQFISENSWTQFSNKVESWISNRD